MKKIAIPLIFAAIIPFSSRGAVSDFDKNYSNKNDYLILSVENYKETISSEEFSKWTTAKPSLFLKSNRKAEIENIHYCPFNSLYCRLLLTMNEALMTEKKSAMKIDREKIVAYLEDFARKVDKDPVDAKFSLESGIVSVFSTSETGIKLDTKKSADIIIEKIGNNLSGQEISIPYEKTSPNVTTENVNNLGITSLIGEGRSNFRGSPTNRIKNIRVAASRFNGILIKPGEDFSFVKTLGDVDEEHGYFPELVIKKDKTEPEFGGGICQVSTTAFRAAINSGLKITARRNHAYPVKYYNPQGMDATVYVPRPDLRFLNNTPAHILIQTRIEGTELIFSFYGTDDGRKVEIDGPKILERKPDGSMKTTFTQLVKDNDGKEVIRDVFNSNYDSPDKYPHPGQEVILTDKPSSWSDKEWKAYKKAHGM